MTLTSLPQVNASLEEQAFTEAWGAKAKALYPESMLATFTDQVAVKLIKKIKVLGPANLPASERETVRQRPSTARGQC